MAKKKKAGRGGARPGAGRKPTGANTSDHRVQVRALPDAKQVPEPIGR